MKKTAILIAALMSAAPVVAPPPQGVATEATKAANAEVAANLPIADQQDFENANRGFLARIEEDQILNADGSVAWDSRQFDFLQGQAPDTVNPSLWRQGKLNSIHGLFEVVPGIYQIRGYDLAQMTLIAGKTGWIVIDPLTTPATATILAVSLVWHRQRISSPARSRSSHRTAGWPSRSARASLPEPP